MLCGHHAYSIKRYGDPGFARAGKGGPGGNKPGSGAPAKIGSRRNQRKYKTIKVADKHWMLEHRYVMEQKLGRKLLPGEQVHHINGLRDDNRPENLELWTTRNQPHGARVVDLLKWAHEIIDMYESPQPAVVVGCVCSSTSVSSSTG